jgi:hypothetical protein
MSEQHNAAAWFTREMKGCHDRALANMTQERAAQILQAAADLLAQQANWAVASQVELVDEWMQKQATATTGKGVEP